MREREREKERERERESVCEREREREKERESVFVRERERDSVRERGKEADIQTDIKTVCKMYKKNQKNSSAPKMENIESKLHEKCNICQSVDFILDGISEHHLKVL